MMIPKTDNRRKTPEEKAYYDWLSGLFNFGCCLTGRTDAVQFAHTGGLAESKGTGRKADLATVLPLQHIVHLAEEAERNVFWANALPGENHIAWAARLFECFEQDDQSGAVLLLWDMRDAANRIYLEDIMRRAA